MLELESTKNLTTEVINVFPIMWYYNSNNSNIECNLQPHIIELFNLFNGCKDVLEEKEISNIINHIIEDKKSIVSFVFLQFFSQQLSSLNNNIINFFIDELNNSSNSKLYSCNIGSIAYHTIEDDIYKLPIGKHICNKFLKSILFDSTNLIMQYNIFFPINYIEINKKEDVKKLTSSYIYKLMTENKKLYMDLQIKSYNDYFLKSTINKF